MRTVSATPDPWRTWEWRVHVGQAADVPTGTPRTLEEMRIAHNVAVASGDEAGAKRWREQVLQALTGGVSASFTRGVELVGTRVTGEAQPRVECWFEVTGEQPLGELTFAIRSTVEARAPLSLVPPDPVDREMAGPPPISTRLWRPHFLYVTDAVLDHRIGRERYTGRFRSREATPAPERVDGTPQTTLVVLP
jgi:hypothetical protein